MKVLFVFIALLVAGTTLGQRKISPTDTFSISGRMKNSMKFSLSDLDNFSTKNIGDVVISNQHGEIKDTVKNLKGILLKDLFEKVEFQMDKPKDLNAFYFTCTASDNYKAVFSWNEIFNTETGSHIYLITERDGKTLSEMDDRIAIISVKDFKTGRR